MGVKKEKDTLTPLMLKMIKAMSPIERKKILSEAKVQWRSDNILQFNKQTYADENGKIKDWIDYKNSTILNKNGTYKPRHSWYYTKTGQKKDNTFKKGKKKGQRKIAPAKARYNGKRSQLLRDNGLLRQSLGAKDRFADIDVTTADWTDYGSKLKYANRQHKMRPIVSMSKKTMKKVIRIYLRNLGVK